MKANELRIGNWVEDLPISEGGGGNGIMQVDGQVFADFGMFKLKGIALTPEILMDCGFKQQPDTFDWATPYHFQINGKFILVSRNDKLYYIDAINTEVNYLHQLQNLFYALTGEELIYTP